MNVYQLPQFLNNSKPGDLYVHHYRSDKPYVKNKIALNQNLICILLNGTKEVFGSHESIKIDNKEILLISAGNVIMWESIAHENKLESILIFFSNDVLREWCVKHNLDFSAKTDKSKLVARIQKDRFMFAFEQSMKALGPHGAESIQRLKVEELVIYLSLQDQSAEFSSFIKSAFGAAKENKLRDVVFGNVERGLSIDELAFLCNMSASTFKRHFEKTFKCSPKRYFIEKRMEKAKRMLLLDKRPSEIYRELRYQNLSSFSTEFKKYFGFSPKQFQMKLPEMTE